MYTFNHHHDIPLEESLAIFARSPMRKPSVLHIAPSLSNSGGISTILTNYLSSELSTKYAINMVASHVEAARFAKLGTATSGILLAGRYLFRYPSSIVHLHIGGTTSAARKFFYGKLASFFDCPVLCHFHTGSFPKQYAMAPTAIRVLVRSLLETADLLLCVSSTLRNQLLEITRTADIKVISNPISMPHLDLKLPLSKRKNVNITFVGTVSRAKGVFDLISVFEKLANNERQVKLNIAGKGDTKTLFGLAYELNIAGIVNIFGWIDSGQRDKLLRETEIFVIPSYSEGMPMAALEAMSYGIPIVGSNVGGLSEIIEHGKSGFLCPPGDLTKLYRYLNLLVENNGLRKQFGCEALKIVASRCSISSVTKEIDDIYSHLIETKLHDRESNDLTHFKDQKPEGL